MPLWLKLLFASNVGGKYSLKMCVGFELSSTLVPDRVLPPINNYYLFCSFSVVGLKPNEPKEINPPSLNGLDKSPDLLKKPGDNVVRIEPAIPIGTI